MICNFATMQSFYWLKLTMQSLIADNDFFRFLQQSSIALVKSCFWKTSRSIQIGYLIVRYSLYNEFEMRISVRIFVHL